MWQERPHEKLTIVPKERGKREETSGRWGRIHECNQEIEASMYVMVRIKDEEMKEYVVDKAVNVTKGTSLTQVLLDNQADMSVMHPMMLSDVRPAERNQS